MIPGTTLADLDDVNLELRVFRSHFRQLRGLFHAPLVAAEFVPVHVRHVGELGSSCRSGRPGRSPPRGTWRPAAGTGGHRRRRSPWCARRTRTRAWPAARARSPRPIASCPTGYDGTARDAEPGLAGGRFRRRRPWGCDLRCRHGSAYLIDVSSSIHRPETLKTVEPCHACGLVGSLGVAADDQASARQGGRSAHDQSAVGRARACRARAAARDAYARLRAAQAAQLGARRVPRLRVRVAVPVPQGTAPAGPDRRGGPGRADRQAAGRAQVEDRVPADRRRQGAAAGPARRGGPGRLGRRRVRSSLRVLRPDSRRHQDADPGGQAQQARGAPGQLPRRDVADPGAAGQLHARTAAARPRVGGTGSPLAQRTNRLGTTV